MFIAFIVCVFFIREVVANILHVFLASGALTVSLPVACGALLVAGGVLLFSGAALGPVTPKTVHHAISLGCNCHTSALLKSMSLKKYSCPFDWLAGDMNVLLKLLETDFSDFLKVDHLCDHPEGDKKCGHLLYGSSLFHHFNPRQPEHMSYYQRCVNRFRDLKKRDSQEHVLYIHQAFYVKPTEEVISKLHSQLTRYSNNFTLLFIYYSNVSADKTSFKLDSFVPHPQNVMLVQAEIRSDTNGVCFMHKDDSEGMAKFLATHFDFSQINQRPFESSDIKEEKSYIVDLTLQ